MFFVVIKVFCIFYFMLDVLIYIYLYKLEKPFNSLDYPYRNFYKNKYSYIKIFLCCTSIAKLIQIHWLQHVSDIYFFKDNVV